LQQALAELRVVVVDLAGALGGVDHEGVLRAHLAEQIVDGRVGDALGDGTGAGAGQLHAHSCTPERGCPENGNVPPINSTNRSALARTSSLTSATSNSARAANCSGDSVPRWRRRRSSSSIDGGSTNTLTDSGIAAFRARAPCRSTSTSTG